MKPHLRKGSTNTNNILDRETGELIQTDSYENRYLVNSKEYFFLAYSYFLVYLQKSKDIKVQLLASLMMRYLQGQEFSMGRQFKDRIAKECNCASRSLDVPFSELIKEQVVIPLTSRLYILNPIIAFKGGDKERKNRLRFVLEFLEKKDNDHVGNFENDKRL